MGLEARGELGRGRPVALADRDHADLHRREPEREGTRVVLDQDAHEALERPEQRPVDHVREVLLIVAAHVTQVEALWHL